MDGFECLIVAMFEVELNGMFDATLCRYLYRSADAFHASSILDCKAHCNVEASRVWNHTVWNKRSRSSRRLRHIQG
jgi:hypothetical protein